MTADQIRKRLRRDVDRTSYRKVAESLGFSPSYIFKVCIGDRDISDELARAMGYKRVIRYVRINGQ